MSIKGNISIYDDGIALQCKIVICGNYNMWEILIPKMFVVIKVTNYTNAHKYSMKH